MEWSGFGFHEHEQYLDKPNNYQARELHCQQYRMQEEMSMLSEMCIAKFNNKHELGPL